jgi:N-carbamoylputrescine amidase
MPDDPEEFEKEWGVLRRHVRRNGSDIVLLPEMPFYYWFCSGPKFDQETWRDAVRRHEKWVERLPELEAPVVLASRPVDRGARRLNEGFVWNEKGRTEGVHFKNYLPNEPGYYEARWYQRGGEPFMPFEVSGWKAGFMICSDLWSMVDARSYGERGVELIAAPRCTPLNVDKWLSGGKTAAVVAGAYCVSSNRSGKRGAVTFGGRGWVVGPDAEVLALTSSGRPFVTVEIDRARARRAKDTYPRYALRQD